MKEDLINKPSHYIGSNGIECIDAMEAAYGKEAVAYFCKCNAFKYLFRADKKGGESSLKKANWYINKYLELSKETWLPSVLHNNYYVSNLGNIRYKDSDDNIKPLYNDMGYAYIIDNNADKPLIIYTHEEVIAAFVGLHDLSRIYHIDGNKTNNNATNLRYKQSTEVGYYYDVFDNRENYMGRFNSLRDIENKFNIPKDSLEEDLVDSKIPYGDLLIYHYEKEK